jgi:prophage maintenance system killer protein
LRINGYRLQATNPEIEKFTLDVAQSRHTFGE